MAIQQRYADVWQAAHRDALLIHADVRRIHPSEYPVHEVLVEQSVLGWKEFELELMRDKNDNVGVVGPIDNNDPMGVHTRD